MWKSGFSPSGTSRKRRRFPPWLRTTKAVAECSFPIVICPGRNAHGLAHHCHGPLCFLENLARVQTRADFQNQQSGAKTTPAAGAIAGDHTPLATIRRLRFRDRRRIQLPRGNSRPGWRARPIWSRHQMHGHSCSGRRQSLRRQSGAGRHRWADGWLSLQGRCSEFSQKARRKEAQRASHDLRCSHQGWWHQKIRGAASLWSTARHEAVLLTSSRLSFLPRRGCSTDICPLACQIRSQLLAGDSTAGFALDYDAQPLSDWLLDRASFPEIPERGLAASREIPLLGGRHGIEVIKKLVHKTGTLPNSNAPRQYFLVFYF